MRGNEDEADKMLDMTALKLLLVVVSESEELQRVENAQGKNKTPERTLMSASIESLPVLCAVFLYPLPQPPELSSRREFGNKEHLDNISGGNLLLAR